LHWDLRDFVKKFSYSDELQSLAEKEEEMKKMMLAIGVSFTLFASALTAAAAPFIGPAIGAMAGDMAALAQIYSNNAGRQAAFKNLADKIIKAGKQIAAKGDKLDPVAGVINNGYIGLQNLVTTLDPAKDTSVHILANL
jgi:hypothetical protein